MDHNRFDNLTRVIGGTSTRRRFSGTLAALGLGSIASLSLLGADEADAKKRGKKNGKKKVTVCHDGQSDPGLQAKAEEASWARRYQG